MRNDGRISMAFWCNDAHQTTSSQAVLNQWNHVVFTYDGGTTIKFYMNGQLTQQTSVPYVPDTVDGPVRIGSTDDPGRVFNGLIDEVIIYNRALSTDEIKAHYDAAQVQPPTVNPVTSPTSTKTITLSGTKPAATAIMVNGTQVYALDELTTWQGTYTLNSGSNTLSVTAMDSKGLSECGSNSNRCS